MKIVGCDLHTRYQQIAMLEEETGELVERRLEHESGEARASAVEAYGVHATTPSCGTRAGEDTTMGYQAHSGNGSTAAVLDVMRKTTSSLSSSSKTPLTHVGSGGLA